MPVTAKLSRRFYEQLGDDVANELVNWFNAVDDTYRNQLRELNDLNWERFRAELRAEGAAIRADVRAEMDKGFAEMEKRFDAIDARFGAVDVRFSGSDVRFTGIDGRFDSFEARIDARFAQQDARLLKWMFTFWLATIIPLAGLIVTLTSALQN